MKQIWNDQKSILLTRAVVALAIAGSVVMTVCGPKVTHWMVTAHGLPPRSGPLLLGMGYACAALALVMLCSLYQFLRRIEAGEVFVSTNVAALRRISWCCAGAAGFCLLAAGIYLPFLFLAVAAGFMALIVRVLKNAFAQAVRMKDELDYTVSWGRHDAYWGQSGCSDGPPPQGSGRAGRGDRHHPGEPVHPEK